MLAAFSDRAAVPANFKAPAEQPIRCVAASEALVSAVPGGCEALTCTAGADNLLDRWPLKRLNGVSMHRHRVPIGAALWILAAQFFIAQVVVAAAWPTPFSLVTRYISDLGNTECGASVCSPWHASMNASFVLIGVTMAAGACFARPAFAPGGLRDSAVILFIVAGLGVLLVGVFPENEHNVPHTIGAGLNFFGGNAALILFGLAADRRLGRAFALFSVVSGVVGLVATVLFGVKQYLVIGVGGMERLAAYPMPIWQIIAGLRLWRDKP